MHSENLMNKEGSEEIPTGVSIESTSYMESKPDFRNDKSIDSNNNVNEILEKEHTPKLFSDEQNQDEHHINETESKDATDELFDQDTNEDEDFEIPAFLRRQKF